MNEKYLNKTHILDNNNVVFIKFMNNVGWGDIKISILSTSYITETVSRPSVIDSHYYSYTILQTILSKSYPKPSILQITLALAE